MMYELGRASICSSTPVGYVSRASVGIKNARVLPDPVSAVTMTSRPLPIASAVRRCTSGRHHMGRIINHTTV